MNIENKTISIIIPVYNIEKYISDCISSILKQTYSNIEIIIVNDGSTDSSGSICDTIAKKHDNIIVIHKKNEGVSIARNIGINRSSGDYLMFVDGDDYLSYPEAISDLMKLANKNGFPDSIFYQFLRKYTNNKEDNGKSVDSNVLSGDFSKDITYLIQCWGYAPSPWEKIIKRDIVIKNKLYFNEGWANAEDYFWSLELIKFIDTYIYLDKPVYVYRVGRTDSANSNLTETKINNIIDVLEKSLDYISTNKDISSEKRKAICNFTFDMWNYIYPYMELVPKENRLIAIKKMKKIYSSLYATKLLTFSKIEKIIMFITTLGWQTPPGLLYRKIVLNKINISNYIK